MSGPKKRKPKCEDCGRGLGINDYVCSIDPYSDKTLDRPRRVNLCVKCYKKRVKKNEAMLSGKQLPKTPEEILEEIKTEEELLPPEQRPSSKKKKKKKKLEKQRRKKLLQKLKDQEQNENSS